MTTNPVNPGDMMNMPRGLKSLNAGPTDFSSTDFLTQGDMMQEDITTGGGSSDFPPDNSNFPDLHKGPDLPSAKKRLSIDEEMIKKLQESKATRIDEAIAKDINSIRTKNAGLPVNPLSTLKELIQKGELKETFEMYGITWTMRALDQSDLLFSLDAIKDSLDTSAGRFTALTFAQIVFSIEALNGLSIYEIFPDIKVTDFKDEQEYIYAVKIALKKYLTALPPRIIDELYLRYIELDEKRNKAIDDLKNS